MNVTDALAVGAGLAAAHLVLWLVAARVGPPRTAESVAREIVRGLEDGSVVLRRDD